jgi:rare lipoprotein A
MQKATLIIGFSLMLFMSWSAQALTHKKKHVKSTSSKDKHVSHHTNYSNEIEGIASYYHKKFEGRKTATGSIFKHHLYTAASNRFPLNTYVKVTNLSNQKEVYVLINDRMSAHNKRVIDLTHASVKRLNFKGSGLVKVRLTKVTKARAEEIIASYADEIKEEDTASTKNNKAATKVHKRKLITKKQKNTSTKKTSKSNTKKQAVKPIPKKPIKKTVK